MQLSLSKFLPGDVTVSQKFSYFEMNVILKWFYSSYYYHGRPYYYHNFLNETLVKNRKQIVFRLENKLVKHNVASQLCRSFLLILLDSLAQLQEHKLQVTTNKQSCHCCYSTVGYRNKKKRIFLGIIYLVRTQNFPNKLIFLVP